MKIIIHVLLGIMVVGFEVLADQQQNHSFTLTEFLVDSGCKKIGSSEGFVYDDGEDQYCAPKDITQQVPICSDGKPSLSIEEIPENAIEGGACQINYICCPRDLGGNQGEYCRDQCKDVEVEKFIDCVTRCCEQGLEKVTGGSFIGGVGEANYFNICQFTSIIGRGD